MKYWLMKAEPNSRLEKGKDVKVSPVLTNAPLGRTATYGLFFIVAV